MSNLVEKLMAGDHPVELRLHSTKDGNPVKETLSNGYVHVKFIDTQGGTELGFHINRELSDLSQANLDDRSGSLKLVGQLTLDYVHVRCIATIDVRTCTGTGHLALASNQERDDHIYEPR